MKKSLGTLALLAALTGCNVSDDGVSANNGGNANNTSNNTANNTSNNATNNASNNGADMGTPDAEMPECSQTMPCAAPASLEYAAACVDGVCVLGCADGYQDNDEDGTCTIDCATNDPCNGLTCDDSSGTAVCSCPQGFSLDDSQSNCILDPVVTDPEFAETTAWTVTGWTQDAVALDPNGFPGLLSVDFKNTCGDVRATQDVYIPPFETTGPLAVSVSAQVNCQLGLCSSVAGAPVLSLGGSTFYNSDGNAAAGGSWNFSACVPPSLHDGVRSLAVRVSPFGDCNDFGVSESIVVNSVQITEAPECTFDAISNGDFEAEIDGSYPGWFSPTPDQVTVANVSGNNVLRLSGTRCGAGTAFTNFVATGSQGKRLSFRYRSAIGSVGEVAFPRATMIQGQNATRTVALAESQTWTSTSLCLPSDMLETNIRVRFRSASAVSTGACNDPNTLEIDDVVIEDDAACAPGSGVTNGDFERPVFAWLYSLNTNDSSSNVDADAAYQVVNNSTVVSLQANTLCARPTLSGLVHVPTEGENALAFDYRYRPFPQATAAASLTMGSAVYDFVANQTPQAGFVCLPKGSDGLLASFDAFVAHFGGCGSGVPVANPGLLQIDNLRFSVEAGCP